MLLLGCAAAQHEAVHDNLYRTKRWNRVAGALWSAAFLFHFGEYRAFHLAHHANTNTPDDPEPRESFDSFLHYLFVVPIAGAAFLMARLYAAARTMLGTPPPYIRTASQCKLVNLNSAFLLVVFAALTFGLATRPALVFAFWLLPLLLMAVVLVVLVTIPEHYDCEEGPGSALVTTRTTVSNRFFRFFFWNTNYHAAHHLCPSVPSKNLERVHEAIATRCANVEPSYMRWHWRLLKRLMSGGSG